MIFSKLTIRFRSNGSPLVMEILAQLIPVHRRPSSTALTLTCGGYGGTSDAIPGRSVLVQLAALFATVKHAVRRAPMPPSFRARPLMDVRSVPSTQPVQPRNLGGSAGPADRAEEEHASVDAPVRPVVVAVRALEGGIRTAYPNARSQARRGQPCEDFSDAERIATQLTALRRMELPAIWVRDTVHEAVRVLTRACKSL
jgi:hypothetical protein